MKQPHATVLPPAPDIYTERPKGMAIEKFKKLRSDANKLMKARLQKGFLVFKSQELILDEFGKPVARAFKKGRTHVGTTRYLQLV